MDDLIQKGYAERVPQEELLKTDRRIWYIPHHGVYHPKKPEKIRVVFDCAARFQGVSLNESLLQGPNLTNNLIGVLLRFRQEAVAVMADVEAMFHQVRVPQEDRDFLRFLWWPEGDVNKTPVTYRMCVHLFGATSSPSCSVSALRATASTKDDSDARNTMLRNFYVDDCLRSVSTDSQAIKLMNDLTEICASGGFRLTKWLSNRRTVLEATPEEERAKAVKALDVKTDVLPTERALGVTWKVERDTFSFDIKIQNKPLTRRGVLSITSSVYDPLGLASPFVLPAKILLQDLCRKGLGWDDPLSEQDKQRWKKWLRDLPQLEALHIPRCFTSNSTDDATYQLHTFCDASDKGYGVVSYIRTVHRNKTEVSLVLSKSRVAPLKKITIPRLELTAATVGVRMSKMIEDELDIKVRPFFWTDSVAVLKYIANESSRFHTFVANRIALIRDGTTSDQWRYVPTNLNPADYASRGLSPGDAKTQCWIRGPEFLSNSEDLWPKSNINRELLEDDVEVKQPVNTIIQCDETGLESVFERTSDWMKLKRIFAIALRFIRNAKYWMTVRKDSRRFQHQTPYPDSEAITHSKTDRETRSPNTWSCGQRIYDFAS